MAVKKLRKDPLAGFTKIEDSTPSKKGTYRIYDGKALMVSYWDGSAFEISDVSYWSERAKTRAI